MPAQSANNRANTADTPASNHQTFISDHRTHSKGQAMAPLLKRKRATAIVEYADGILLTLMRAMGASLPGGGVKPGESDEAAVIRELWFFRTCRGKHTFSRPV